MVLTTGLDALEKVKILAAVWSRTMVHGSPSRCLRAILAKPSRVPSVINRSYKWNVDLTEYETKSEGDSFPA
jgi:hypothetical protein